MARSPLASIAGWPVPAASAACRTPDGSRHVAGDQARRYPLASLTKVLTAVAVLIAAEEGTVDLDAPVDPSTITGGASASRAEPAAFSIADLLAHSAGLSPDEPTLLAEPRSRRIYSNAGFELAADLVAAAAEFPFADYQAEALFAPLGMSATTLDGSPAHGATSSVDDVQTFLDALLTGRLLSNEMVQRLTEPHLPGLEGVLPGYGRQAPNPWGLGPEIRGAKSPHWTGYQNSPSTWGHFGQSGAMFWHDPDANATVIALADEPFGPWAQLAWPTLSDDVLNSRSAPR